MAYAYGIEPEELNRFRREPQLLELEIRMRVAPSYQAEGFLGWRNFGDNTNTDWRVVDINPSTHGVGDYVVVYKYRLQELNLMRITKVYPSSNSAAVEYAYPKAQRDWHVRVIQDEVANVFALQRLFAMRKMIESPLPFDCPVASVCT